MSITFQYLGNLSEALGLSSESVDLSGSLKEMIEKIKSIHPEIEGQSFIVSVNGTITHQEREIREGDIISLIPPAPGG